MLDRVFAAVLSMALSAGFVVCAVLLARLALQKAPKVFSYALWAVVLFRLLCPVSFESPWSLQRVKPNSVTPDIVYAAAPQIDSGLPALDGAVNASLPAATPETSANPMQTRMFVLEVVWLCGLAALLLYSLVTLLRVRRSRLARAVSRGASKTRSTTESPRFGPSGSPRRRSRLCAFSSRRTRGAKRRGATSTSTRPAGTTFCCVCRTASFCRGRARRAARASTAASITTTARRGPVRTRSSSRWSCSTAGKAPGCRTRSAVSATAAIFASARCSTTGTS